MTLDRVVIFISLIRKNRNNDTWCPVFCKDNGEHEHRTAHHHHLQNFGNQHNPGFLETEILMQCDLNGTGMRFLFVCLFVLAEKHTTDTVLMEY